MISPKSIFPFLLLLVSCQQQTPPAPLPLTPRSPLPTPHSPSPTPQSITPDPYEEALSRGVSAATIASTSQSPDDRALVQAQWSEAIALMKSVPKTSPNYTKAQSKITEYQRNLNSAKQPPTATARATTQILPKATIAKPRDQASLASAEEYLRTYLNSEINQSGGDYWCAEYKALEKTLYSPRSYKILSSEKRGTEESPAFKIHTTIESSNKGGSPIVVNWNYYLIKNKTSWCIANMNS